MSATHWEIAYQRTAKFEGGWSDDASDRGGKTNRGVTEATWINYWRSRSMTPPCTIRNATEAQTKQVLQEEYWKKSNCDKVGEASSAYLSAHLFDACVHHGPKRGQMLLQQALNYLGAALAVDGTIGTLTIASVREYSRNYHDALIASLLFQRAQYFDSIFRSNPSQLAYKRGWFRRLVW